MTFKPTGEQQGIVKAAKENEILKVNSCAGSGKSSTLALVANANPEESLYLAFNKAIADEAKESFPDHVTCKTTHSLAFSKTGVKIKHKLNRPKGGYVNVAGTPNELSKYYNITPIMVDNEKNVSEKSIASLILKTVFIFQASADDEVCKTHVPFKDVSKQVDLFHSKENEPENYYNIYNQIIDKVERYSKILWEDRINPHSPVLATHDTYLKMYQLSKPKMNYKIIYGDEFQDVTDCVLDIFLNQDAKKIIVGDARQSIYGWRMAINAMKKIDCPEKTLSKSFRYGQKIAEVGTAIIEGEMEIEGNSTINTEIGIVDREKPFVKIFRTNGALLIDAVNMIQKGFSVTAEVDTRDFSNFLDSAEALKFEDFKKVKHDKVIPYSCWEDFEEASDDDPEIKRVAKIINSNQKKLYSKSLYDLNKNKNVDESHIKLITAHKVKGLQFDQVVIADDFKPFYDEKGEENLTEEEKNLLYVACTRAVKVLQPNDTVKDMYENYWGNPLEIGE